MKAERHRRIKPSARNTIAAGSVCIEYSERTLLSAPVERCPYKPAMIFARRARLRHEGARDR